MEILKRFGIWLARVIFAVGIGSAIMSAVYASRAQAADAGLCRAMFRVSGPRVDGFTRRGTKVFRTKSDDRFAFETIGPADAEKIVLFFNGIDKNMSQWDAVVRNLEARRPNVLYVKVDLLGQGETSQINPVILYKIPFQRQIAGMHEFLNSANWDGKQIVVSGHSYGGGIAARLVRERPGYFKAMVLENPFVDYLEEHQPGMGPAIAAYHSWMKLWGLNYLYNEGVNLSGELGMVSMWPMYSTFHGSRGRLTDMLALTRGIRDIEMTRSVQMAGTTRVSMVISLADELIPMSAHKKLFAAIPKANAGNFTLLPASHESVSQLPKSIATAIIDELDAPTLQAP